MPAEFPPSSVVVHKLGLIVTSTVGPYLCRTLFVGRLRKELALDLPFNVSGQIQQRDALQLLEGHCRLCRRCKLGRE